MRVELRIVEQDPERTTTIPLPPSETVNGLLYKVASFWDEQAGRQLDKVRQMAYDGEVAGLVTESERAFHANYLYEACQRAAEVYDIRLNRDPKDDEGNPIIEEVTKS